MGTIESIAFRPVWSGLLDGLTENNAGGLAFEGHGEEFALDWAAAVDRFAEYVDHATEHAVAYVDRGDLACALDGHVFSNVVDFVEEDDTHIAFLKVEGYTFHSVSNSTSSLAQTLSRPYT